MPDRPVLPPPTLRLKLDHDALAMNWRALNRLSGNARAGAAVKADAYGLGVAKAVPSLRDAGARDFFVAHWSEVSEVIAHVPAGQISVLHGPVHAEDCAYARALGVRPVINSIFQARLWLDSGGGPCDLMVDTGINRLGLPLACLSDPLIARLDIDVLLSHLASADEDVAQNAQQLRRFDQACRAIPARRRSLSNSAGIALGKDYAFDLTRPGLSLYGGIPRSELLAEIGQVARLEAAIIQRRDLSAGDSVGYNATFTAARAMRAGVVSLGYADGFLRCWSDRGLLRSNGRELPLLGRVSMDMVVVDLTEAPDLAEGDWLEVPYHLPDAAAVSGLSQYELLTILGQRFRRG
ncbi:alanine racemase [Tsuneonella sp. CC-YZS046]|uniref:alanine racemase n=1 Tax=Tsuneonella sp. CC-YZS046 TaxID=3042152 RepID=UPI002D77CC47|nr:alanine racemase [Tsuneonella sp. CC-YZS046]WRO67723.1 alanine racemase [Tsuneonella sp. CC-YZS046]